MIIHGCIAMMGGDKVEQVINQIVNLSGDMSIIFLLYLYRHRQKLIQEDRFYANMEMPIG